jgi:hypothetical protein
VTNLQRRLKKLEARSAPRGPLRLVVRYPDEETEYDFDENDPNTLVVVVWSTSICPPKHLWGRREGGRTCPSNS